MFIDDGIIAWFNGPEWDDVGADAVEGLARGVEDAARGNAPWDDRTGDARSGLKAEVQHEGGDIILTLYHTVEYGLWLEVIQNGSFATIMPTLEQEGPRLMREAAAKMATARNGRG
jgi:hypothetical protein